MHLFMSIWIKDHFIEHAKERDEMRASLLNSMSDTKLGYDSTEEYDYGRSNDTEPLPYRYTPLTEETEDGFVGLAPPLA